MHIFTIEPFVSGFVEGYKHREVVSKRLVVPRDELAHAPDHLMKMCENRALKKGSLLRALPKCSQLKVFALRATRFRTKKRREYFKLF